MPTLKLNVEENKSKILHNSYGIINNEQKITDNKKAIEELKLKYVPYDVFENAVARYDKIVHRLILIICGIVALLFLCNAIWLYAWKQLDFKNETIITQEGTTNKIGK